MHTISSIRARFRELPPEKRPVLNFPPAENGQEILGTMSDQVKENLQIVAWLQIQLVHFNELAQLAAREQLEELVGVSILKRAGRIGFRTEGLIFEPDDDSVQDAPREWQEAGQGAPADDLATRVVEAAGATEGTVPPEIAEASEQRTAPIVAIVQNGEQSSRTKLPSEEDIAKDPQAALNLLLATQQPGAVVKEKKAA